MAHDQIYRQLQVQLDRYPIGYPATKSGVEIDLLKYFFTPGEARIALCLSLRSIGADAIRKRLKNKFRIEFSHKEMTALLDGMFMKGVIRRSEGASSPRYGVAMLAIGMFEYHVDDLTPELVEMMHRYFDEAFGAEFFRSSLPQLRTSPHLAAILPEYIVDTYDNMRHFITHTKETLYVANCFGDIFSSPSPGQETRSRIPASGPRLCAASDGADPSCHPDYGPMGRRFGCLIETLGRK